MTTQQPGLFPEPAHAPQQPIEAERWHILDPGDAAAFDDTATALVLGAFHTLQAARDHLGHDGAWIYDVHCDVLHKPGEWPDTEDVSGITGHRRALAFLDGAR